MKPLEIPPSSLDKDLGLLASQQRRLVIRYLVYASANPVSIDELVAFILDNTPADHTTGREEIQTELHHISLPKLEKQGLIDYEWKSGDVRYHSHDRIETLLECLPDD